MEASAGLRNFGIIGPRNTNALTVKNMVQASLIRIYQARSQ